MKRHTWRVGVDVPAAVRSRIVETYSPRFANVHLTTVTYAYGVESSFPFDPAVQDLVLTGLHRGFEHEAFTVSLGGQDYRPDGRRLFLTFSTAAGVKPAEAGGFADHDVVSIPPIFFAGQLRLFPNFQRNPTPNPAFGGVYA